MRLSLLATTLALAVSPCFGSIAIPGSPADPVADTFGAIPAATFGGSGIPNDAMAISSVTDGGNTILMGITATPRFAGPPVANDGMGAFTVQAGEGDPGLSLWNFSFYTDIAGGGSLADYRFELSYDLAQPGGNPLGTHGVINFNDAVFAAAEAALPGSGPAALAATPTVEGSQNLGFSFLAAGAPGVTPPTPLPPGFDPAATGEYTFQISVFDVPTGTLLDTVSMSVNAVPEPTAALFGSLLTAGLGLTVARRRNAG